MTKTSTPVPWHPAGLLALAVALLLAAAPLAAQQQQPDPEVVAVEQREAEEHARITAERAQIEARVAQAEAACYQRFAVNDCLAKVREERRTRMSDLRRQEVALNDAARKRRAAQQLLRIDERVRDAATR